MFIDLTAINAITRPTLAAAIEVHRTIGPGLLESTYQQCLKYELAAHKLRFEAERAVPIVYKGVPLNASYRIDFIIEDLVIVEVKSVDAIAPVHRAQMLTYLRLTARPVGLVINFNVPRLMDGVKRVINARDNANRSGVPKDEVNKEDSEYL